jgi:hypothetical protein
MAIEPPTQCMGLESAGASTGIGVALGTVLFITAPAITLAPALIIAIAGSAVIEGVRRANWKRD